MRSLAQRFRMETFPFICAMRALEIISGITMAQSSQLTHDRTRGGIDRRQRVNGDGRGSHNEILTPILRLACARTTCNLFWWLRAAQKSTRPKLMIGFGTKSCKFSAFQSIAARMRLAPARFRRRSILSTGQDSFCGIHQMDRGLREASGWRLAFKPYMSASNSLVRV